MQDDLALKVTPFSKLTVLDTTFVSTTDHTILSKQQFENCKLKPCFAKKNGEAQLLRDSLLTHWDDTASGNVNDDLQVAKC